MKENLKIKVKGRREWDEARDLLNSLANVGNYEIYMDDAYTKRDYKLVTFDELRELARPKEYLTDKFELVVTNQPESTWLVIPDGSLYLFEDGYGRKWFNKHMPDNPTSKILWQREKKVETVKGRFLHQEWLDLWISGCDLLFKIKSVSTWNGLSMSNALGVFNNPENEFRIKPQTIQIGSRTINKPINVKPEIGQVFYVSNTVARYKYNDHIWDDSEFQNLWLSRKICHLTAEDAIAMTDAILELMK